MFQEQLLDDQILIVIPDEKSFQPTEKQAFKKKIVDLLVHKKLICLIIDLQQVSFFDHEGIGTLFFLLKYVREKNCQLKLMGLTESLARMFRLIAMDKIFDICDSLEEAIAECKSVHS